MDWDQILGRWQGIRAKAMEALEKLAYEVRRDQRKDKDKITPTPRGTPHVKHFEDMH